MSQVPSGPVTGPHDVVDPPPELAGEPHAHRTHGWAMWLMCLPMLVIVAVLLLSGSAGLGAAAYALACLGMMAAMMLFLGHGARR